MILLYGNNIRDVIQQPIIGQNLMLGTILLWHMIA